MNLICRCGEPRRAGQRNCLKCHRQAQRRWREREKNRLEEMHRRIAFFLNGENKATREDFERKCRTRFVIIQAEKGPSYVVGFGPGGWLDVLDGAGGLDRIHLDRIADDPARAWFEEVTRDLKLPQLAPRPSLACACNGPRSPGQSPCQECRRKYHRWYRAARKQRLQRWQRILEILTVDNPATRAEFEAKARRPFVVITDPGSGRIRTAKVVSFHMGRRVTVVDGHGRFHSVPLACVDEDVGRFEFDSMSFWTELLESEESLANQRRVCGRFARRVPVSARF
jgi:hypothetical protein